MTDPTHSPFAVPQPGSATELQNLKYCNGQQFIWSVDIMVIFCEIADPLNWYFNVENAIFIVESVTF